jgi:hypothetical protein
MLEHNKQSEQSSSNLKFFKDWAPTFCASLLGLVIGDAYLAKKEKSVPITTLKQRSPEVQFSISKDKAVDEIEDLIKANPYLEIIKLVDDYNNPNKLSLRALAKREDNSEMKIMLAPDNFEPPKDIFDNITAHYRLPDKGHTIILYRQTSP